MSASAGPERGSSCVFLVRYTRANESRTMKRNNNKSRGDGSRTPKNNRAQGGGSGFPLPLLASIQVDKVVRFKASAALSAQVVSISDLMDLLCVATTTTNARRLASTFRLRKIEAWAPPDSAGASVVLAIEDATSQLDFGGPSRRLEDVTMGQSRPAHLVWKPKQDSVQSKWLNDQQQATSLLELTCPTGTVFDVHISWILQDGEIPTTVTAAVAGAVAGTIYLRSLCSSTSANLPPVSFSTI